MESCNRISRIIFTYFFVYLYLIKQISGNELQSDKVTKIPSQIAYNLHTYTVTYFSSRPLLSIEKGAKVENIHDKLMQMRQYNQSLNIDDPNIDLIILSNGLLSSRYQEWRNIFNKQHIINYDSTGKSIHYYSGIQFQTTIVVHAQRCTEAKRTQFGLLHYIQIFGSPIIKWVPTKIDGVLPGVTCLKAIVNEKNSTFCYSKNKEQGYIPVRIIHGDDLDILIWNIDTTTPIPSEKFEVPLDIICDFKSPLIKVTMPTSFSLRLETKRFNIESSGNKYTVENKQIIYDKQRDLGEVSSHVYGTSFARIVYDFNTGTSYTLLPGMGCIMFPLVDHDDGFVLPFSSREAAKHRVLKFTDGFYNWLPDRKINGETVMHFVRFVHERGMQFVLLMKRIPTRNGAINIPVESHVYKMDKNGKLNEILNSKIYDFKTTDDLDLSVRWLFKYNSNAFDVSKCTHLNAREYDLVFKLMDVEDYEKNFLAKYSSEIQLGIKSWVLKELFTSYIRFHFSSLRVQQIKTLHNGPFFTVRFNILPSSAVSGFHKETGLMIDNNSTYVRNEATTAEDCKLLCITEELDCVAVVWTKKLGECKVVLRAFRKNEMKFQMDSVLYSLPYAQIDVQDKTRNVISILPVLLGDHITLDMSVFDQKLDKYLRFKFESLKRSRSRPFISKLAIDRKKYFNKVNGLSFTNITMQSDSTSSMTLDDCAEKCFRMPYAGVCTGFTLNTRTRVCRLQVIKDLFSARYYSTHGVQKPYIIAYSRRYDSLFSLGTVKKRKYNIKSGFIGISKNVCAMKCEAINKMDDSLTACPWFDYCTENKFCYIPSGRKVDPNEKTLQIVDTCLNFTRDAAMSFSLEMAQKNVKLSGYTVLEEVGGDECSKRCLVDYSNNCRGYFLCSAKTKNGPAWKKSDCVILKNGQSEILPSNGTFNCNLYKLASLADGYVVGKGVAVPSYWSPGKASAIAIGHFFIGCVVILLIIVIAKRVRASAIYQRLRG